MAAKTRVARTTQKSRRPPRKQSGAAGKVRKRSTRAAEPDMVQAALAAFAHEVRTPLTGILAISDLLSTSDLGERERRWADTIKAGAEHLANLATLFVDAAKTGRGAGKGGSSLRQDLFDLRALARSTGDSLAGRAAAKGLQAEVEISEKLAGLVVGDPVRLRAALENLIDNAVKFTDQGGVAISATPWRPAKGKGGGKAKDKDKAKAKDNAKDKRKVGVAFAVSDSGIGLTMAEIKRLFRPFTQANVTIASRFGGAGLGLSSVKQLARGMGGDITVAPRRGGGATFTLTVSLDAAGPAKSRKSGGSETDALAALRVLSVEDNPFGRVVLNTILTELGHHAEFIGRGEDAVNRLAKGAFDAVLMDMVLPGIDGVEAIRQIRNMQAPLAQIPIIGVSGRGEDEAASREAGADAFLVKPVSPRALATALLEARRREEAVT
ncbi:MAG TPA: ATP-binding protein [Bradyrhizobium sp.]